MTSGVSSTEPAQPPLLASIVPLLPVWRVDRVFDYLVPDSLELQVGALVRVPFGARRVRGIVVALERRHADRPLQPVLAAVIDAPLCHPPVDRVVRWIARRYCAPLGLAFARSVPPRVRVRPAPPETLGGGPGARLVLAHEGGAELVAAIERGWAGAWSLQSVPGEARGELICELVAAAGRAGGAALVGVPEVRFGAPTLDSLARWWPDVARVDASRSERERSEAAVRLARGHGLGAGGRSVVLAAAPELRLIILDDAHNPAYKEDRTPRYDARRVALERARAQGAVCVLASATPPLESELAVRRGRMAAVVPRRAAVRAARPVVEVLPRPSRHVLAGALARRVAAELKGGGRVGLLAPARGYARALWCGSCRRSLRCPRCETGVAFERAAPPPTATRAPRGARLRCPRCGWTAAPPDLCPHCGAGEWRYLGAGSDRLAEQVGRMWPRARVGRVDADVGARDGAAADADVYVTTWFGTKEALRPPVSLVAVLDADALIRRPQWWAAEAAYEALAEMAEWAGPAAAGGRLLVQCSEPGHHAVQAVVRADHRFFVERELRQRAELGYPPFSELLRATCTGAARAEVAARVVQECRAEGATVLGPVPAAGAGDGVLELLVKCRDALVVAARLRVILGDAPPGTRLSIDVDPR